MKENSYRWFENKDCRYYPCHNLEEINCMFCFCPLYYADCGGKYSMVGTVKDCSLCTIPHSPSGWDYIVDKIREINEKKQIESRG